MKYKILLLSAFLMGTMLSLILIAGCVSGDKDKTIINLDSKQGDTLSYSQFYDGIRYIPLETNENCLIGRIQDVRISDSAIVILDGNTERILLFDGQGKYLRDIGRRGEGPEEYFIPDRIDYDSTAGEVFVYDPGRQSILRYNLSGRMLGVDSVGSANDFAVISNDGNRRYLLTNTGNGKGYNGISIYDSKISERRLLVVNRYDYENEPIWDIFHDEDTLYVMTSPFDNITYQWMNDTLVAVDTIVLTDTPKQTENVEEEYGVDLRDFFHRFNFLRTDDWQLTTFGKRGYSCWLFKTESDENPMVVTTIKNDLEKNPQASIGNTPVIYNRQIVSVAVGDTPESNPQLQLLHLKKSE